MAGPIKEEEMFDVFDQEKPIRAPTAEAAFTDITMGDTKRKRENAEKVTNNSPLYAAMLMFPSAFFFSCPKSRNLCLII
jgi:hypothetical protein